MDINENNMESIPLAPLASPSLVVLFAGGIGSRLWPVSTKENPKQVNSFFSDQTLLVDAFQRALRFVPQERIVLCITHDIEDKVRRLIPLRDSQYIIQPERIDTAGTIGLIAAVAEVVYPGSIVTCLYADQQFEDNDALQRSLTAAINVASSKTLVTIATKPQSNRTDIGYIELGDQIDDSSCYHVKQFIEKPEKVRAQELLQQPSCVWNTGMYCFRPEAILKAYKQYAPTIYSGLVSLRSEYNTHQFPTKFIEWHRTVEHESFDRTISQQLQDLGVVVADFTWYDIGNWNELYEINKKDEHKNVFIHQEVQVHTIDSSGCLIHTDIPTGIVGIQDCIIIQYQSKLLICHKSQAHRVKELMQHLS